MRARIRLQMFQKQPIMRRVVYSLIPIFAFSVLLYGWRSLAICATVFPLGIATEYIFTKPRGKKVSEAVLVTCALYALSMPPAVPLWISAIGIVFGVGFGKCIFGGFGRNIFNPAIAGRLFVYVAFPQGMQRSFLTPWEPGIPWTSWLKAPADSASAATPLIDANSDLFNLITGFRMGAIGESAIILIILAGLYLIFTKTANWKIALSTILSFSAVIVVLWIASASPADNSMSLHPVKSLFSGSILFVAVFMATDPVTAPKKPGAQWVYGILIGGVSAIIRVFSLFPEGVSFGVLIGNTFASLLDECFPAIRSKVSAPKVKKNEKAGGAA